MDESTVNKVLDSLEIAGFKDSSPATELKGYESVPFNANNYKPLQSASSKPLLFVDGGNAEILGTKEFSFSFIRVFGVIQDGQERITKKKEFYALVKLTHEPELMFTAEIMGDEKQALTFDPMHESLKRGLKRAQPLDIISIIRRTAELNLASDMVSHMDSGFILLDGTLQCFFRSEFEALNTLLTNAQTKGITVAGLAKSSGLSTTHGNSLSSTLIQNQTCDTWCYHPLLKFDIPYHPAELSFVKLHPKARKAFRFEVAKGADFVKAASLLTENSTDPTFFGYPYGLIYADRFGRVQNEELEYLKTRFYSLSKDRQKLIDTLLAETDSHKILDTIR